MNSNYMFIASKGSVDPQLHKFNLDGTLVWSYKYTGLQSDDMKIAPLSDGGCVGATSSPTLQRFDADGVVTWNYSFTGGSYYFKDVTTDASDNIYVCANGFVAKFNSSGTLQWQNAVSSVTLQRVRVDSAGNVYVNGTSGDSAIVAKFDSSGTLQWAKQNLESGSPVPASSTLSLAVDVDDFVYWGVNATTYSQPRRLYRLDSSGNIDWHVQNTLVTLDGLWADGDYLYGIGYVLKSNGSKDMSFWKRDRVTGDRMYLRKVTFTSNGFVSSAVRVDSDGQVWLIGSDTGSTAIMVGNVPNNGTMVGTYGGTPPVQYEQTISTETVSGTPPFSSFTLSVSAGSTLTRTSKTTTRTSVSPTVSINRF